MRQACCSVILAALWGLLNGLRCTICAHVFALALQGPERAQGFPDKALSKLEDYGFIQSRPRGEYHANNQQMSKLLHKAIGLGDRGSAPQVRHASCDGRAWSLLV